MKTLNICSLWTASLQIKDLGQNSSSVKFFCFINSRASSVSKANIPFFQGYIITLSLVSFFRNERARIKYSHSRSQRKDLTFVVDERARGIAHSCFLFWWESTNLAQVHRSSFVPRDASQIEKQVLHSTGNQEQNYGFKLTSIAWGPCCGLCPWLTWTPSSVTQSSWA